jgi:glutamate N-acetyltransferase/amino-acid N-acetyltransferase
MNNAVPGFLASGISAGIKSSQQPDLGLIFSPVPAAAAAVFTTNKIKAAPVRESLARLAQSGGIVQALIVNSGNANACTGAEGIRHVQSICQALAGALNVSADRVLMASTGIIGVPLPLETVNASLPRLVSTLSADGFDDFAHAIMTTDTFPKRIMKTIRLAGAEVSLCGIAKGAGMIMPRMATMLAFILTDLAIAPELLSSAFRTAVDDSFNAITIDGDTSTNDTALILANGQAGNALLKNDSDDVDLFRASLRSLLKDLARLILKDAEGATKMVTIRVVKAKTVDEAKDIAFLVANSPLVKTAFFGEDLNWGRIMAALGKTEHAIDADSVDILINSVMVVQQSSATGLVSRAADSLKEDEFIVTIDLHRGSAEAEVGTTDLSIEYIKINSAYPT